MIFRKEPICLHFGAPQSSPMNHESAGISRQKVAFKPPTETLPITDTSAAIDEPLPEWAM